MIYTALCKISYRYECYFFSPGFTTGMIQFKWALHKVTFPLKVPKEYFISVTRKILLNSVSKTWLLPFCYFLGQQHFENKAKISRTRVRSVLSGSVIPFNGHSTKVYMKLPVWHCIDFSKQCFSSHHNLCFRIRVWIVCSIYNDCCLLHFLMPAI